MTQPMQDSPDSPRPERRSTPRTITPLSVAALSGDNMLRFPLDQARRAHVHNCRNHGLLLVEVDWTDRKLI